MRILALTRYERRGSSSRLRFHQYLPWLEQAGVEVTLAPLWRDAYLERLYAGRRASLAMVLARYGGRVARLMRAGQFDLVWLEAEVFPYLPAFAERALCFAGVPYVVDYDDAVFHKYDDHPRALVRLALGRKIDVIMRGSALVVAGNEYIAERARRTGARSIELLPTVVDLERYGQPPTRPMPARPRVVWIGTRGTADYLRAIADPLSALVRDGVLEVRLIGANAAELGFPYEDVAWSEAREVALLHESDIGIMPLPDSPFERGKCGYKLLQYMACGLPTVAAPVGVNARIIHDGVNGRLATTQAEWVTALSELSGDATLRVRLGNRARRTVEERYALERHGRRVTNLLLETPLVQQARSRV